TSLERGVGRGILSANIAERHNFGQRRRKGGRCDLSYFDAVSGHLGSDRWWLCGIDMQTDEQAVHVSARADPLDDFLSDIAAFVEVQRVFLQRLLRKCGVENIFAVARLGVLQADYPHRLGLRWGVRQLRSEDAKSGLAGRTDPRHDS